MSVAFTTLFETQRSTVVSPKTGVGTSLITFHFRTSQVTVNQGSGRTQTDYNDLFNQVLTFTTIENVGQTFTNVVPVETRFSAVAAQATPTATPTQAAAVTPTTTPLAPTAAAASPSTTTPSLTAIPTSQGTSATVVQALSAQIAQDSVGVASTLGSAGPSTQVQGAGASPAVGETASITITQARTANPSVTSPAVDATTLSFSRSSGGSSSSSNPTLDSASTSSQSVSPVVIAAGVLIGLLFLGCLGGGSWWFGRRRRRRRAERENGLNPGWLASEGGNKSKFSFDATVAGAGSGGKKGGWKYGFGRSASNSSTAWPEKTYAEKWKSFSFPIPIPESPPLPAIQTVSSPTASYHLFPDPPGSPPSPSRPPAVATSPPASSNLKRALSFPRKPVPLASPRHPYSPVPDRPRSSSVNRGPIAFVPPSGDDGGIRSSMEAQILHYHPPPSVTDSVAIFDQIPSPTTASGQFVRFTSDSPLTPVSFIDDLPLAPRPVQTRGHRAGIPSITLTMATGSMYSETTATTSESTHEDAFGEDEDPFRDHRRPTREREPETESIRSSMSSSELPPLFTTAQSLADEAEARESLESSRTTTTLPTSTASSVTGQTPHPHHHHLPHVRPPPVPSRLSYRPNSPSDASPFDDPDPVSPPFPFRSATPPTPITSERSPTPTLTSTSRQVQEKDQHEASLYRDALEKRHTILSEADSLQDLGSLLGHGGSDGPVGRTGKWPRPPGGGVR